MPEFSSPKTMVEAAALNDSEDDDRERDWPQIIAIFAACMVSLSSGIFFAWTSSAIPTLISDKYHLDITLDEATYLTILPAIAIMIAGPFSGRIIDAWGRKNSLIFISVTHLVGWILIARQDSIWTFYLARIMNGISDSCCFATIPTYIAEVATPKVRQIWANTLPFTIYFGNFMMNLVAANLSIGTTAYVFMVLPIAHIFVCWFMPETPYFLMMKGRYEAAKTSIKWLRRMRDVEWEFNQMRADVQRQLSESGRFKDLFVISTNRRALFIAVIIRFAHQFSGISALSMYTEYIFKQSGSNFSASTSAIIFSACLVLANSFACYIVGRNGRRCPMLTSCLGSGCILLLLAIYLFINQHTSINVSGLSLFPLFAMVIYVIFYSVGLGIVPTLLLGELFSTSIKSKALAVMSSVYGLYICTSSKIFSFLMIRCGLFAPFLFFSICCLLCTIAAYYLVPETKGKTLEQIQQNLKSDKKPKKEEVQLVNKE